MTETILIQPKKKYRETRGGKMIKITKSGDGKRTKADKVSWKKDTGMGKK
jgi:hypothetical protein